MSSHVSLLLGGSLVLDPCFVAAPCLSFLICEELGVLHLFRLANKVRENVGNALARAGILHSVTHCDCVPVRQWQME